MNKNRSGREQAAKASGPVRAAAEETSDLSGVMDAIASSESKILARIDLSTRDLNAKIDSLRDEMAKQETRVKDLEEGLNLYSDKTTEMEGDVGQLKSEVAKLQFKIDDLEGRQRRCNARIVGIKEGLENSGGQRPTDAVAKMLQELLALDFVPTLDRAHRGLRPPPNEGDPPRVIVVKFHYFQEREVVFREAASKAPLTLQGKKVSIFPDYTAEVAKKRAAFTEAKRLLRNCKGVKFGILFPAVLRITLPTGQDKRFDDPAEAIDFIRKKIKP